MAPFIARTHRTIACWGLFSVAIIGVSDRTAKCVAQVAQDPFAAEDPQTQILNRYIRVNCALARRVCKLSDEQEQRLALLNDAWVKAECVRVLGVPKEGPAAGFARMFGFGAPPQRGDIQPQEIIGRVTQEIDKNIMSCLDEEQAEAFKSELDARLMFRRESHATVIVGILDQRLFLTDDQRLALRDAITASLEKDLAWMFYVQNENYLPTISKQAISKVLDKEQLAALSHWRETDFDSIQFEQQMLAQQEQFVIEK